MQIALAQINPIVGDLTSNKKKIIASIEEAKKRGANLVVFPEMALLGYPPEDLLLLPSFIDAVEETTLELAGYTKGIAALVGTVRRHHKMLEKPLHNSCALCIDGKLEGFADKILLPDYDVFSERRYFSPGEAVTLFELDGKRVAVTICEDIWHHAEEVFYSTYERDPVLEVKEKECDLLINLSSSPYYMGRGKDRLKVCQKACKTLQVPMCYCNLVGGNDGLIFDGGSFCLDSAGQRVAVAPHCAESLLMHEMAEELSSEEELFRALTLGIRDYFHKQGFKKALLGISGGIDSALVLVLAMEALGKENVLALLLPSRFTPKRSIEEARQLTALLGIELQEISIEPLFQSALSELAPYFEKKAWDITEENLQTRVRATLLMAFSNKFGHLLLNTGNKSELALGYMTLYGDMCGALSPLGDVTKEKIYRLAKWINRDHEVILHSIIDKEPSAELKEGQKDIDTLPPYPLLDRVIEGYIENHLSPQEIAHLEKLDLSEVQEIVKRIHLNEYKRRQTPLSLRVTKRSFTVGRRFPIVQKWNTYA